jgi:hypothetical protein
MKRQITLRTLFFCFLIFLFSCTGKERHPDEGAPGAEEEQKDQESIHNEEIRRQAILDFQKIRQEILLIGEQAGTAADAEAALDIARRYFTLNSKIRETEKEISNLEEELKDEELLTAQNSLRDEEALNAIEKIVSLLEKYSQHESLQEYKSNIEELISTEKVAIDL